MLEGFAASSMIAFSCLNCHCYAMKSIKELRRSTLHCLAVRVMLCLSRVRLFCFTENVIGQPETVEVPEGAADL